MHGGILFNMPLDKDSPVSLEVACYFFIINLYIYQIGIPEWIVDLRHEIVHSRLPSVQYLRKALIFAKDFICVSTTWHSQENFIWSCNHFFSQWLVPNTEILGCRHITFLCLNESVPPVHTDRWYGREKAWEIHINWGYSAPHETFHSLYIIIMLHTIFLHTGEVLVFRGE